ncbi:hypothetical protein ACA910_022530 [Epithemia clementina (nom. ined.)]
MTTATVVLSKQVLNSLPPLGKDDEATIVAAVKELPGFEESQLEEWKAQQCLDTKNATTPLAESLLHELQTQMDKQYGSSSSSGGHQQARHSVVLAPSTNTKKTTNNNALLIRTHVQLYEPLKFRAGSWSSEWHWDGTNSTFSGTITMQIHSYEDDTNVQLRATRQIPPITTVGGDDAAALVQHMQRATQSLYHDLSQDIFTGHDKGKCPAALKKVRRILPITKTRMKWDDAAQEQIRLLNDSKAAKPKKKITTSSTPNFKNNKATKKSSPSSTSSSAATKKATTAK